MNVISSSKVLKLAACFCGCLVLLAYIGLLALYPAMYWLMDGGFILGLWLVLASFAVVGGWWVIWREAPKFSWIWLGGFMLLHLMLFNMPAVQEPWKQDRCLDASGWWRNGKCFFS
ncbi:MAG: hypothetical protein INF43_05065 [Alphaproteobacteria bacterium]|jgi:hypothetical protein|nr:hypothetical protein [Alphaproteobacteria bacterium]